MARGKRPAQGRNENKRIVKIKAGGPIIHRGIKSQTRPRRAT